MLIAEDNTVNQTVAAAMVKRLGYRVDVVANGREAVEALERVSYAAVLMDCQMPEMGYEVSREIRLHEGGARHVPIVALTASAIKGDGDRCFAAGIDAYVTKPVTLDALGTVLPNLIEHAPVKPEADVLDQETLASIRDLGGGTLSLLNEMAGRFIDSAPADIAVLVSGAAKADVVAVAQSAHRLKGSCGEWVPRGWPGWPARSKRPRSSGASTVSPLGSSPSSSPSTRYAPPCVRHGQRPRRLGRDRLSQTGGCSSSVATAAPGG